MLKTLVDQCKRTPSSVLLGVKIIPPCPAEERSAAFWKVQQTSAHLASSNWNDKSGNATECFFGSLDVWNSALRSPPHETPCTNTKSRPKLLSSAKMSCLSWLPCSLERKGTEPSHFVKVQAHREGRCGRDVRSSCLFSAPKFTPAFVVVRVRSAFNVVSSFSSLSAWKRCG